MIASLVEFSLRQRTLIIGLACLCAFAGIWAFESLPIDAYPDVTNVQVQVLTEAPGLSPTIQSPFDSRISIVRASPADTSIEFVTMSEFGSSRRISTARATRITWSSMYAWNSQHTRMITAPSSGESPNNGFCGYLRSR